MEYMLKIAGEVDRKRELEWKLKREQYNSAQA